jgi:hypothetical protein
VLIIDETMLRIGSASRNNRSMGPIRVRPKTP